MTFDDIPDGMPHGQQPGKGEENALKRFLCVSLEPRKRIVAGIAVLPYREFLEELWNGVYD